MLTERIEQAREKMELLDDMLINEQMSNRLSKREHERRLQKIENELRIETERFERLLNVQSNHVSHIHMIKHATKSFYLACAIIHRLYYKGIKEVTEQRTVYETKRGTYTINRQYKLINNVQFAN